MVLMAHSCTLKTVYKCCSIAQVLVDSGCEVPDYMLRLDKATKTERRKLASKAPKRKAISTEPAFEREKRQRIM